MLLGKSIAYEGAKYFFWFFVFFFFFFGVIPRPLNCFAHPLHGQVTLTWEVWFPHPQSAQGSRGGAITSLHHLFCLRYCPSDLCRN